MDRTFESSSAVDGVQKWDLEGRGDPPEGGDLT